MNLLFKLLKIERNRLLLLWLPLSQKDSRTGAFDELDDLFRVGPEVNWRECGWVGRAVENVKCVVWSRTAGGACIWYGVVDHVLVFVEAWAGV